MKTVTERIPEKIQELLDYSAKEVDYSKGFGESLKKMRQQDGMIKVLAVFAKISKTLLGRTMQFQYADSYALYVITKVNKKTVELTWVDYCDGWVDDRIGKKGTVSLKYAEETVYGRDRLDACFAQAQAKKAQALLIPLKDQKKCIEYQPTSENTVRLPLSK
jgi:hypothetical protein